MAILKKGILGAFSGKVGTVIGALWRTMAVMRSLPKKTTKPSSDVQVLYRRRFGKLSTLLHDFESLIDVGFFDKKKTGNQREKAIGYNMQHAFGSDSESVEPDLSKVVLSMGNLFRTTGAKLVAGLDKSLSLTWNNDEEHWSDQHQLHRGADYLMIAVMTWKNNEYRVSIYTGKARRADLEYNFRIPSADPRRIVHLWLFFASEDGKSVSKSEYFKVMLAS